MSRLLSFELKDIGTHIGRVSIVGIAKKEFPLSYGNYFSMGGYSILNMWHENFQHLRTKDGPLYQEPTVKAYVSKLSNTAIIVDSRIPEGYLNTNLCFSGTRFPNSELAYREAYQLVTADWEYKRGGPCLCDQQYEHKSVAWHSIDTMKGVKKGVCRICKRNHITHFEPAPAGRIMVPLVFKTEITSPEIHFPADLDIEKEFGEMLKEEPDAILSRYLDKKVNPKFFGSFKLPDDAGEE